MRKVVVIGAGVGGLTAASLLAKEGFEVSVLERHVYPGGCAATFYHQGYRFDAGATLAGGFGPGGVMGELAAALDHPLWRTRPIDPAMVVHLSDGRSINRWGGEERWAERARAFAPEDMGFWRWQERRADAMWEIARQNPPWPPSNREELVDLSRRIPRWLGQAIDFEAVPGMLADAILPVAARLRGVSDVMRRFIDAQLLISAQTTSARANGLYAAAALDLPRRGVVQIEGGMGAIAGGLVDRLQDFGGAIHFKQQAVRVRQRASAVVSVETAQGESFPADLVIGNLPPWNFATLFGDSPPDALRSAARRRLAGWGAFVLYLGVDSGALSDLQATHHQIILREPLGEGNSAFLSVSPDWDASRAPVGRRAVTMSTHTRLDPWWHLMQADPHGYERRKERYTHKLLSAADQIYPGFMDSVELLLQGTPVSFQRYTGREAGWVGGFPQTSLFRTVGPRLREDVWLVGDSIFPGQSTAAVAMGGMRVARAILGSSGRLRFTSQRQAFDGTMHSAQSRPAARSAS